MRKLLSILLALTLLLGCGMGVFASEDSEYDFEGKDWDTIAAEFMDRYGIDPDTLAFGYYNTVTGEEHYHNGDKYMIAASVYKLPLNMYFSEKVYTGEIDWTTTFGAWSYEAIQRSSIESSNNELSELLCDSIGSFRDYRAALAPYCGFESDDMNERFYNADMFTPKHIIHALKMLYEEPERFPRVIDYMKLAQQDNYFCYEEERFEIAHKYGFTDAEGYYAINDCAIVYTDDPILLVMFTNHCAGSVWTLARYCTLMCDYAQYTRAKRLESQPQPSPEPEPTPEVSALPQPSPEPAPQNLSTPAPVQPQGPSAELPDISTAFDAGKILLLAATVLFIALLIVCKGWRKLAAVGVWAVMCVGIILLTDLPADFIEKPDAGISAPVLSASPQPVQTAEPQPETTPQPTPEPTPPPSEYTITTESAAEIEALAEIKSLEYIDATASREYEAIFALRKALPDCEIIWQVDVFGQLVDGKTQSLSVVSDGDPDELEQALQWLPELKMLDIKAMSLENVRAEALMAAHPELEIIWTVNVGPWRVPSDATVFSTLQAAPPAVRYTSEDFAPLFKYCTELVALDLGHNDLTDLSGLANLKKLKVLIIIDNPNIVDMSPVGELTELEYLEFFMNDSVADFTPLNKLTKLVDLNLSYSPALDNVDFLQHMPDLKRAWLRGCSIPVELWGQAMEDYPGVEFTFWHATSVSSTCGSWRADERNVAIRQAFTNWKYVSDFNSWDDISYVEGAQIVQVYPAYEN